MKINSFNGIYRVSFNKRFIENQKFKYFYIVDKFFENKNLYINKSRAIYIKANEENKSYLYVSTVISKLLKKNIDKKCIIVCIGGGVVQDIASFVSSILFRGIKWVYIPTTLSAQSDSCIGNYLRTIYDNRVKKNKKGYDPKSIGPYSTEYGGQFHMGVKGLKDRVIFSMDGRGGQQIILDMENNRILIVNSTNQHYNWKKLVLNVIKKK